MKQAQKVSGVGAKRTKVKDLTMRTSAKVQGGLGVTTGLNSMEVEPVDFKPKGSLLGMEVEPVDFIPKPRR